MTINDTIPSIDFDETKGTLSIVGNSIPEDPVKVFQPLMERMIEYSRNPLKSTIVTIRLDYVNTSSMKWIFHVLEKLEHVYVDKKLRVEIKFFYSDENTLETGKYLQMNMAIPIDLIKF